MNKPFHEAPTKRGDEIYLANVFAFKRGERHVCAVVIESDPTHIKCYPSTGLDPDEIWQMLRCTVADSLKSPNNEREDISFAGLIHRGFDIGLRERKLLCQRIRKPAQSNNRSLVH